jgi:hypothetical protein
MHDFVVSMEKEKHDYNIGQGCIEGPVNNNIQPYELFLRRKFDNYLQKQQ